MITEFIASKDVSRYWQEKNCQFTDFELATLVYQSTRTIEEKQSALQGICERNGDGELAGQIRERIAWDNACIAKLQNAENCIYQLEVWEAEDEQYECAGYFKTFDRAKQYAAGSGRKYTVTVVAFEASTDWNEDNWGDAEIGAIYYNACGKVVDYWTLDREPFAGKGIQRFEEAYMQIPHPFVQGDIVRIVGTDKLGVVRFCDVPEEQFVKMQGLDFVDTYITLEVLQENAEFEHEHISPLMLEYANLQEGDYRRELLESVGYLIAGSAYIESFQRACKRYKKSCEERPQRW